MVTVIVSKSDSIDTVLRKFEAKCRRAQIYKLVQKKSYYVSKSEQKHRRRSRRTRSR